MGVTAFKSLSNFSGQPVRIMDTENGSSRVIQANSAGGFDYWSPWCTSQGDFSRHHIELEVPQGTVQFCIWQSADQDGDFVRFSTDRQYHGRNDGLTGQPGTHVPGVANVDGNRLLIVHTDGTFEVQQSG